MWELLKSLSEHYLGIATIALAVITFFYLIETRSIRRIADKSFQIETSPKVFLARIDSKPALNTAKKEIEVKAVFKIMNVGKTEAKSFIGTYTLAHKNVKVEGQIGPLPYLFPTQVVHYDTKMLGVMLNEKNFSVAKEAMDQKKPLIVPKDFAPPISLDLNLRYFDQEGKEQNLPYRLKYLFHSNAWVYLTDK